ncbi:hypothetical protein FSOLCH5_012882 [Fusarium solani]|uniref:Small ribosomal subunit protein bS18m n=1 Tax=Fusarium solani TaxID=169388 RepID=A0A9P9I0K9_FUSSL|nr:ribosomal protein S18 [Fusarium solani]KAH7266199.1 ribosomal protein S18 [Fusarium solani]KAJ3463195.1 hypothetical protein MRS44_007981 [Fusarium solani]KAJ4222834.1 hypothetical protein NW759_006408 [Fusarium solani]
MPPRLPTTTAAEAVRAFVRPFSCTASAALPPREPSTGGTHTSRLANLNSNRRGADRSPRVQPGDAAARMMERYKARDASFVREKTAQMEFLRNQKMSSDFLRQMPRRWEVGDVYSPHDLSPVEMQKWRKRSVRNVDVVDALGISPLDMYKNFSLIEHFTSPSGMINHSQLTRLRPVNQRKVAKMVRRVQGMGIYPTIHAHPEMLRDQFFGRH